MLVIAIHLSIMLFSPVTASSHLLDAENSVINPTLLSCASLNVYGMVVARTIWCSPSEEHSSQPHSDPHLTSLEIGWHTMGVGITATVLASVVWLLWNHSRGSTQDGAQHLSVHQAGRSDAVVSKQVSPGPSRDCPSQQDGELAKSQPRHKRSAAVVSVDTPSFHTPTPHEYIVAATDQRPLVPYANAFLKLVVVVCRASRTWFWPSTNRPEQAVACLSVRPRDSSSLRRSLHKGSRDLSQSFPEIGRCIFLVVGVDTSNQKDAENDTEYLRQMFESSTNSPSAHRYKCLYGPNATCTTIRKTMLGLLDEARVVSGPFRTFMLFTGTGNGNNAMCLSNGEVLSESDLTMWLPSPAKETNESNIGVLFDICRMALSRLATKFQSVELAWSCSVGEFAYAIRLSKDKLIPRSIFLLAIFLAAHDMKVHKLDGCYFEAAFAFHIKQLSELIQFMYRRDHQDRCPHCPAHKQCDAPVAQNPDLQQAGRVVSSLGMVIATHFPERACEVYVAVDEKMLQEGFPGRLCPMSVLRAKQANKPTVKDES